MVTYDERKPLKIGRNATLYVNTPEVFTDVATGTQNKIHSDLHIL
jgi:hypothetical protein